MTKDTINDTDTPTIPSKGDMDAAREAAIRAAEPTPPAPDPRAACLQEIDEALARHGFRIISELKPETVGTSGTIQLTPIFGIAPIQS